MLTMAVFAALLAALVAFGGSIGTPELAILFTLLAGALAAV